MSKWKQGTYQVRNLNKYAGNKMPTYRSSWELAFCNFCDDHPSIIKWASENVRIPYQNPLTGKLTNYVPDFLVQYIDKNGKEHVELIEIKPSKETTLEGAKSIKDKAAVAVNTAKWAAAQAWCQQKGIRFKVLNEHSIFHTNPKRNNTKRVSKNRIPKKKK
jgi:hypothetical protein